MDRIKVKQVEGALDDKSEQIVTGSKAFAAPQHFPGESSCLSIYGGALYWCQTQGVLDEAGNTRVTAGDGVLLIETFDGRSWTTL